MRRENIYRLTIDYLVDWLFNLTMFNKITPKMMQSTKSIAEVKADFNRNGITIRQWAKEHGIGEGIVYELLRGRFKGYRGQAHKAAVLLGLKEGFVK